MKLYIKSSTSYNPFNTSTTGMSYYDNFLNEKDLDYMQQAKNLTGEIIMMSPNEYYEACSHDIFKGSGNSSVEDLKRQREHSRFKDNTLFIDKYKQLMQSGKKFDMCVLNYAKPTQEGLHRMYAAGELYGWDTRFPVLVVNDFDKDLAEKWRMLDKLSDFEKYEFKDICDDAINNLIDKYYDGNNTPENAQNLIAEEVEAVAKSKGYDLEVQIDEQDLDGIIQYLFRVVSFNGFVNPNMDLETPFKYWKDDLWGESKPYEEVKMTPDEVRKLADDYDIDLSDDILSLFFKP